MINNNFTGISAKKILLLSVLVFVTSLGFAQKSGKIEIGAVDSIFSKTLNENRKILVHLPKSTQHTGFARQKYPVLYLLDGDNHFSSVVGMIEQLSEINTLCPEMIIVAIPNTNRTRDLTPTHIGIDPPFVNKDLSDQSGGGEKFTEFLEKELIPYIDSKYPTTPYRTLIGHSFGGLTVINILANHTSLFNSYIAIDPSMWWDHQNFLKQTEKTLEAKNLTNVSLFLGIANTTGSDIGLTRVKKDTTVITKHIRSILDLSDFLTKNKKSNLKYGYKYYKDESHGSVPLITTYDGLRFIFDFYKSTLTVAEEINFNKEVLSKIEKQYQDISRHLGYKVKLPEALVNNYGYRSMSNRNNELAGYLFKINVANYPDSPNTYDSLGDFYVNVGDKENAIANYQKVLDLDKNFPETKGKLDNLLK